jgi:hypothetical protein
MAALRGLTARKVATAKPGRHSDGAGLYLNVTPSGSRQWVFRFTSPATKRVTEMGLGSAAIVSLAEARDLASEARKAVKAGLNPIVARREAAKPAERKPTFGECSDRFLEAKASEWRNAKHRAQWAMTLATHAAPLANEPVDAIGTDDVLEVLKPLWTRVPETASRLRGRIEAVLDAAKAQGHRHGENPARWRGHLDKLLPKLGKLARGHHAAMPYRDVQAFVASLREREAVAAMALEFTILTATRSGEVLGAQWSEFDLAAKVWTIPAAGKNIACPCRLVPSRSSKGSARPRPATSSFPASARASRSRAWRWRWCFAG